MSHGLSLSFTCWVQLTKISDKDIVEMIFFPVVNEACRVLAEGIAVKPTDLDIASVMGFGFPPYRSTFLFHRRAWVSLWNSINCNNHILRWWKIALTSKHCFVIRGGVMFWADSLGSKYIYSRLDSWAKTYGDFFKPCAYLAERAAKGISLVRIR